MPNAEHDRGDRFNEQLDALTGGASLPAHDLDPTMLEEARRFFAYDDAPRPPDDLAARLWEDLMHQIAPAGAIPFNQDDRTMAARNGRVHPHPRAPRAVPIPIRARRFRGWFAPLAALLLVVVLAVGSVAFWSHPFDRDHHRAIPAAAVPATPTATPTAITPTASAETLVDVTLPAGSLPVGQTGAGFGYYAVPVGSRSSWVSANDGCCPELRFTYVVRGSYTVRSQGTVLLLRASGAGSWETLLPGTEVVLDPGDASITSTETGGESSNLGSVPVDIIYGVVTVGSYGVAPNPDMPLPMEWVEHDGRGGAFTVPAGPVRLLLQWVSLPAGATFPAPAGAFRSWVNPTLNATGSPEPAAILGTSADGAVTNYSTTIGDTLIVYTLEPLNLPATPSAGTPTP